MFPNLPARLRASWTGFRAGLAFGLILAALAAMFLFQRCQARVPDVRESVLMYFEELEGTGKLVLLTARQRFTLSREFSSRILALIDIQARIDLSVMADLAYYIDVTDPSDFRIDWDPRSRHLSVLGPRLQLLPPAILTQTIAVQTGGANLVSEYIFKLRRAAESMKAGLSGEVARQAELSLRASQVRKEASKALEVLIAAWLSKRSGLEPERIEITFGVDEQ